MKGRAFVLVFVLVMVAVFSSGCVHREMSAHKMIADMQEIRFGKSAIINILWYQGSDARFDYFAYVYSMSGTKNYKVSLGQFVLKDQLAFTDDSDKWVRIKEINGVWSADRLYDGVWIADREGIGIQVKRISE